MMSENERKNMKRRRRRRWWRGVVGEEKDKILSMMTKLPPGIVQRLSLSSFASFSQSAAFNSNDDYDDDDDSQGGDYKREIVYTCTHNVAPFDVINLR